MTLFPIPTAAPLQKCGLRGGRGRGSPRSRVQISCNVGEFVVVADVGVGVREGVFLNA